MAISYSDAISSTPIAYRATSTWYCTMHRITTTKLVVTVAASLLVIATIVTWLVLVDDWDPEVDYPITQAGQVTHATSAGSAVARATALLSNTVVRCD